MGPPRSNPVCECACAARTCRLHAPQLLYSLHLNHSPVRPVDSTPCTQQGRCEVCLLYPLQAIFGHFPRPEAQSSVAIAWRADRDPPPQAQLQRAGSPGPESQSCGSCPAPQQPRPTSRESQFPSLGPSWQRLAPSAECNAAQSLRGPCQGQRRWCGCLRACKGPCTWQARNCTCPFRPSGIQAHCCGCCCCYAQPATCSCPEQAAVQWGRHRPPPAAVWPGRCCSRQGQQSEGEAGRRSSCQPGPGGEWQRVRLFPGGRQARSQAGASSARLGRGGPAGQAAVVW